MPEDYGSFQFFAVIKVLLIICDGNNYIVYSKIQYFHFLSNYKESLGFFI